MDPGDPQLIQVRTDFNERSEGRVMALLPSPLNVGDLVELRDSEGNRVLGSVSAIRGELHFFEVDWSSWVDGVWESGESPEFWGAPESPGVTRAQIVRQLLGATESQESPELLEA